MPGHVCCVCGNSRVKDPGVSFHRFPANAERRAVWLRVFELREEDIKPNSRVCTRHFPDGDAKNPPVLTLGKHFASPIKIGPRLKRARQRDEDKQLREHNVTPVTPCSSRSVTPAPSTPTVSQKVHTAVAGEQFDTAYQVHELPSIDTVPQSSEVLVNVALLARIEALEAENASLKLLHKVNHFRVEDIQHSDKLVRFYTGFVSFMVFLAFLSSLGLLLSTSTTGGPRKVFVKDIVQESWTQKIRCSLHLSNLS